jgi:hypothetical protein
MITTASTALGKEQFPLGNCAASTLTTEAAKSHISLPNPVNIAPVQQQRGASDCALCAIAFAISLA